MKTHRDMLQWQYRTLLAELSQVTLHASDESCPCNQVELTPPEYCLAKHLLNVSSLAQETALMDDTHRDTLDDLAAEALEHHETSKTIYCKGGEWPDLAQWSREARKKIEPIYYACSAKVKEPITAGDVAKMFANPVAQDPLLAEGKKYQYAKGYLPKEISVHPNVITKHYVAKEDCQRKTFRVLKPEPSVLVYICCAKGDKMKAGRCHPNPTVHKTITPRSEKYEKALEHLRKVHPEIPVTYHKEEGVEAKEPLTQSAPIVGEEHSVGIPLACPGTEPISPALEKALKESEVA